MRLIVRTEAETDIARGFLWYENQRDGLGREFLQEISSRLAAIEQEPLRFPRVVGAIRRAMVRRFPYGICFVVGTSAVSVLAAMHMARDPRRLRRF